MPVWAAGLIAALFSGGIIFSLIKLRKTNKQLAVILTIIFGVLTLSAVVYFIAAILLLFGIK